MNARRLLGTISLFALLTVSALAQLSQEAKVDVLRAMDRVLTEEAFVPGIDLGKWPDFIRKREDEIHETESPVQFANLVNGALREFGISHIRLNLSGRRPGGWRGGEELLLQRGSSQRNALRWLEDGTAYLRISSFAQGYDPREIEGVFEEIEDADALVLDLRSNGGGLVENMHHLLSKLLPRDAPVGTFVTKRTANAFIRAGKGDGSNPIEIARWAQANFRVQARRSKPFRGKVVVLQDQGSASASEIVASALRENLGSAIVGTRSAGAVLMSTFERLPHGFQLQYPISDYVSYKGVRLEGNPIAPDVALPVQEARSSAAVEAALAKLKGR